jgi:hypothetical protein
MMICVLENISCSRNDSSYQKIIPDQVISLDFPAKYTLEKKSPCCLVEKTYRAEIDSILIVFKSTDSSDFDPKQSRKTFFDFTMPGILHDLHSYNTAVTVERVDAVEVNGITMGRAVLHDETYYGIEYKFQIYSGYYELSLS